MKKKQAPPVPKTNNPNRARYKKQQQQQTQQQTVARVNPNDYGPLGNFVNPYLAGSGSLLQALARGGAQFLNTVSGRGDYDIKLNTLLSGNVPTFVTSNNNSVRMAGVEYLGKVTVPTSNPSTWKILPGFNGRQITPNNASLFPILSKQVNKIFKKWKPWGIIFYLKSLAGTAVTSNNPAIGGVIGAIKTNPSDNLYVNEQEMLNTVGKRFSKNNDDMLLPVECSPAVRPTDVLFSEVGNLTEADYKLVSAGSITFATTGCPNGGDTHQIYVAYDMEFFDRNPTIGNAMNSHYQLKTDVSTSNYFGSDYATKLPNFTTDFGGQLNVSNNRVTLGTNTLVFDNSVSGNVKIEYIVHGASTALTNPILTPSAGATGLNDLIADTASSFAQNGTMTAIHVVAYYALVNGGTITFSGATFPNTVDAADLYITPVDDNFS